MSEKFHFKELCRLRAVAAAASPGPWQWDTWAKDEPPAQYRYNDEALGYCELVSGGEWVLTSSTRHETWAEAGEEFEATLPYIFATPENATYLTTFDPTTVGAIIDELMDLESLTESLRKAQAEVRTLRQLVARLSGDGT